MFAAAAFAMVAAFGSTLPPHSADSLVLADGGNPRPVQLLRAPAARLSAMAQLGRLVFYDRTLSSSGAVSCASCHDAQRAYGPPNDRAGMRAVPSLMYLERQPAFSVGPDDTENEAATPQPTRSLVPQGGLFWDGRADTLQSQALGPLLNPLEMHGGSVARVAEKLRRGGYAPRFAQLFGPVVFERASVVVGEALFAVARYQIEDISFHPYSSKYDRWLEGTARFTAAEARGYRLFNDPARGNCAACHLDRPADIGLPPLFTDHQYEALGVPRNAQLANSRNANYYDLGICGPLRTDLKQPRYCGLFLTPTLRNVATRHAFFHNGVYHTLRQVLDFYDFRASQPQRVYPRRRDGSVAEYDDLPRAYQGNIDTADAPFDRRLGQPPALTGRDERDIIAFLQTLTDGYQPRK